MKIKNWHKLQHFKDRRPQWIKLYRDILDDLDINMISPEAFKFLIQVWLLASEDEALEGGLPSVESIAFRLRLSKNKCLDLLRQIDIFLISDGYQVDALEIEKRRDREEIDSLSSKLDHDGVSEIFKCWQTELNHPRATLDSKRRKVISARIKEGYTKERIMQAIRGVKLSPHNMGQNDRNTRFDDIELICRSGANVDRFADLVPETQPAKIEPPKKTDCDRCNGDGLVPMGENTYRCPDCYNWEGRYGNGIPMLPQTNGVL